MDVLSKENQQLGLIIDLTFTTRYYNIRVLHIKLIPAALLSISVEQCKKTCMCSLCGVQDVPESLVFLKIYTKGHDVPNDRTILSFKRAVHRFLRDNAENGKHGVNC